MNILHSAIDKRRWLKAAAAAGLLLLTGMLGACGEGKLPPVPPPPSATINLYGSAV